MRPPGTGRALLLCALIATLAIASHPASAQTTTASLTGSVRGPDGEPIAGAHVEAVSEATGVIRTALTDAQGRYRIDLLPPGVWTVVARQGGASGPRLAEARTLLLRLQQTAVADFVAGAVRTETVEVNATPSLVDTSRIGSELRIDGNQVEDLPLAGRQFTDLALLDSSVYSAPAGDFYGERGSVFVVNGQSGRSNSFLLDGLDNNDQSSNTAPNSSVTSLAIREFTVLTNQYAPEFGRASGGILNIVTERGSNDWSIGGFTQGVVGKLNPAGEFVSSLPDDNGADDTSDRYSAGIKMSGPLRRDRAAFFLAYEHQQADEVTPYTGVGRDGVAGGWVKAPSRDDNIFLRTDFNLGAGQFLMARLSADDRSTHDLNVGGNITPEAGFMLDERDVSAAATLTSVLSPTVVNEARLLVARSSFDQNANSDRPGVERPSGTFGGNNLNMQKRDEDRLQLVENITWQRGPHTMKAGFDVLRSRTTVTTRFNPNGNFLYSTDAPFEPGDCGNYVVDPNSTLDPTCIGMPWVDDDGDGIIDETGQIDTFATVFQLIEGVPTATIDDTRTSVFVQDSWQATPGFLLNYGLRYDISSFTLPSDARVDSWIPNGGAGRDTNNIAPRFGFTWDPGRDGRFIVRGGAGLFYDKIALGFPAVAAITSGTRIGLIFPEGLGLEITEDVVEQYGIDAIKVGLVFPEELILQFSTGTELDTPFTEQYSVGMEHAVGQRGVWSATATRALGHNQVLMRDLNPVVTTDANGVPIHRDSTVGSIAAIETQGQSWYSGLTLDWKWRSEAVWYSASYTWSKTIDMAPDPLKGGIYLPDNSDDLTEERGRSDSDRRHRFVLSGSAPLPGLGLRASGVIRLASGLPYNVTTGGDENLDGITTDRPKGVGRNTGAATDLRPVNRLRRDAGLKPVGSLNEPAFFQVDVRLSRPFGFRGTERGGEVFLEVFNLLDRFNAGTLNGVATSSRFGEPINQAGPPRTLELGLKLAF